MVYSLIKRCISAFMVVAFMATGIVTPSYAQNAMNLPVPGTLTGISRSMHPVTLQGLKVDPQQPFRFKFLVAKGDSGKADPAETDKLVRYFFNALTTPEKEMWVNLSPIEGDRIVAPEFGLTSMGRDLLSLDYILKQVTSSLMYPEDATGKAFWNNVYSKAHDLFGTTDIPTDVFNKVWVVSSKAKVYENGGSVYITEDTLDVMLDSDHALTKVNGQAADNSPAAEMIRQAIRENILPIIKKEVNEGEQFAALRQVHRSLILATWYKKRLKDSLLARAYGDRNKIAGLTHNDPMVIDSIYSRYVEAFKQGVYNYVREDKDIYSGDVLPRKYFAGGMQIAVTLDATGTAQDVQAPANAFEVQTFDALPIGAEIDSLVSSDDKAQQVGKAILGYLSRHALMLTLATFISLSGTQAIALDTDPAGFSNRVVKALKALENPNTKFVPSHVNMPGLENIAFTYDLSVEAAAYKAAGQDGPARNTMNAIVQGFSSTRMTREYKGHKGFVNSVNIRTGNMGGENEVTPGPNAWIGLVALLVDPKEYLPLAQKMGDLLLAMQGTDGGILDGDRNPDMVITEPHMDGVALFERLYDVTGHNKWNAAAQRGRHYFKKHLYSVSQGTIVRSLNDPEDIFATDAYSWSLLGKTGDELPLKELKTLITNLLSKSLVRVEAPVPGGKVKTLTLVDYTDPRSAHALRYRGGLHPVGSVEWTSGVIMALQKAAVRLASSGDMPTAKLYKAIAEELLQQVHDAFGALPSGELMSYYATESGVDTTHGWKTPGPTGAYQGSPVGAWVLLPMMHVDPFSGKNYGQAYGKIQADDHKKAARDFMDTAVSGKTYSVVKKSVIAGTALTPDGGDALNKSSATSFTFNAGDVQSYASDEWKAKSYYVVLPKEVELKTGQEVRIEYSLNGSDVMAVQLVARGQSPDSQEGLEVKKGVKGVRKVVAVVAQKIMALKQIVLHVGPNAWGALGGSMSATANIHKVDVIDKAASVGGIDFEKIDLGIDAKSGAMSFEVNEEFVTAFQERLLGIQPLLINSQPLSNVASFMNSPK
ncbi:MAG: hypothetical protein HQL17_02245 [Candidatus Omnitrophica bacterium]|nr:hypothetical protein [Candidatus Omnitrophota bacterium]